MAAKEPDNALAVTHNHKKNHVHVEFAEPVAAFGLDPDGARRLAAALIENANCLDNKAGSH